MPSILAYLDPGSGSLLLQLMLGGAAAVGVSLKMYWGRVLRFLRIRRDDEEQPSTDTPVARTQANETSAPVGAGKGEG